ncbi:MAG: Glutamate--tRNA ligase 1 [Alphaproteobacteria bacterium MarineAlpha5_Bin12]|nr:MAG: Glutamate--tRNA ligase 1 [Alphaproteobacteria bacterium MarineAlpha5_Bin12]|tara:strand:+ start:17385 stop:18728 length:1344 start_codon:yes stop_codon:yes gene_type:complete
MSEKIFLTRFAPSPTGRLHIGNARSAILNWIFAKKNNGDFILRIDDTDIERSKDSYIELIKKDLQWLNLSWSKTFKQSERKKIYNKRIEELKNNGRLYPCFESQEELLLKRKSLLSSGKPPIYDRSSLKLSEKEKENYLAKGTKPHWRFFINEKKIYWNDLIRGEVSFESENLSDPILIREDGSLLYHLPSVIDDISENITHIIRGEDHISNTAFHIQIFEALKSNSPTFGHHSLLIDKEGKGMSKRMNSFSIDDIQKKGFENLTILNYLSTIGTSNNLTFETEVSKLIELFEISDLAKSTAKFNEDDLIKINSNILKKIEFKEASNKLKKINIHKSNEEFWNLIKNNINFLNEAIEWWAIVNDDKIYINDKNDFLIQCASVLPSEPYDINTWEDWLKEIKKLSKKTGKDLFMPLRMALTGKKNGPEIKYLLPLLTKAQIIKRLGAL